MQANRGQLKAFEKAGKDLKERGQHISVSTESVLLHYWFDKRLVKMITTIHSDNVEQTDKVDKDGNFI